MFGGDFYTEDRGPERGDFREGFEGWTVVFSAVTVDKFVGFGED